MKLYDLIDKGELDRMLAEGYVVAKQKGELVLLSYTAKAQWDRVWNATTLNCRGLIYSTFTGDIVARPFPKFFNYNEPDVVIPDGPIRVTAKMDGSLGVLYFDHSEFKWKVATRGSFDSEQAVWATNRLSGMRFHYSAIHKKTFLVEIIYPENRIVVDYGQLQILPLLAVIDNETGLPDDEAFAAWPGLKVLSFDFKDMKELLEAPPKQNAEGFVVYFEKTNTRLKVKYEEYVRLHKLVTNLTNKTIWEYLSQGKTIDDLIAGVPDEFYEWVRKEASTLEKQFADYKTLAEIAYKNIIVKTGTFDRKAFARFAVTHPLRAIMFLMFDSRNVASEIWKQLKPAKTEVFKREVE